MFLTNYQFLTWSVLLAEVIIKGHVMSMNTTKFRYLNQYGDDYGKKWIYFPDGEGVPQYVNLSVSKKELEYLESNNHRGELQLEFRLYTKTNKDDYISLDNSAKVINGSIDASFAKKPFKILTHGWSTSALENSMVIPMKDAYLESSDVNVIGFDWTTVAYNLYTVASFQIWDVGVKLAEFIEGLETRYGVRADQVHLIGHSLGAHVFGIAGHVAKSKIGRITGLDPALPLFNMLFIANPLKLDASDAKYVDIIHTCGGLLGFMDSIGTADFYPNGGVALQPGCDFTIQNLFEGCSHYRSCLFYMESIRNPKAFPTYKCTEWTRDVESICDQTGFMGELANMTGDFYLATNPTEPYGRGLK